MTRLRMEVLRLEPGDRIASTRGLKIWLDGHQFDITDLRLHAPVEGIWMAQIEMLVAIEGITQAALRKDPP
jgi:hypothetical protein